MGDEKVKVLFGFVSIGFDNEQRLLKNWLARGDNRSTVEVLTNIVCAQHDEASRVQNDASLHRRNWAQPSPEQLERVFENVPEVLESAKIKPLLFEYLASRIAGLLDAGEQDKVSKVVAEAERNQQFLVCPSCSTLVERRLRNCPNSDCSVGNARAAIARHQGVDLVSTEHVRTPRPAAICPGTTFHYSLDCSLISSGDRPQLTRSRSSDKSAGWSRDVPCAKVVPVEPFFVNPNSHKALRLLLRHIGHECGIKNQGGSE